ncbi:MAG: FKBP-type peptidyl-prolyl cis-trans isomerase [Bacteroidia bacterium]|nr:FKBP-type peptidyl-prolyl cis-trans isomerase [Bacteroidia bacterium]
MEIGKNRVVSLTYTLTINSGEVVDTATNEQPFTFIHGLGMTLPLFESNLQNLKAGDAFDFNIDAENGYGISSEEFKVSIPREVFNGPEVPADILQIGNMVPMQDQDGNPMNGVILEFDDSTVKIDFNHPLADQDLTFKGEIISVREATSEELDHGHVHGPGGHHH